MNNDMFLEVLKRNTRKIDDMTKDYFSKNNFFDDIMLYATYGGKRIRANLYLESKKMFSKSLTDNDYICAFAIELIHAYSLVHDDLPSMDNDDYRRGKESVHKKFGEDLAVLAGDALLNEASLILLDLSMKDQKYLKAAYYILDRVSRKGMIHGQVLDLRRGQNYDLDYLLDVYSKKTSDLFKASCVSAALSSGASKEDIKKIIEFAHYLGLAFQLQDDLLEDDYKNELNILNIVDKNEALAILDDINKKAHKAIDQFKNNEILAYLIDYLTKRSY